MTYSDRMDILLIIMVVLGVAGASCIVIFCYKLLLELRMIRKSHELPVLPPPDRRNEKSKVVRKRR